MRAGATMMIAGSLVATMLASASAAVSGATAEEASACVAEVEPNDGLETAPRFEGERCITGALVEVGDVDVFVWEVSAADAQTTWSLEFTGEVGTEAELTLSAADDPEVELARVDTIAERETATTDVSVDAGSYVLVVRRPEASGAPLPGDGGGYELRLVRADAMEGATEAAVEEAAVEEPVAEEAEVGDAEARIVVLADGDVAPRIGASVALELVLDTSGSMLERLGQRTKLDIAEGTLIDLVDELPSGIPVALRTFKAKPRSCATVLRVPLEPLRPKAMKKTIRDLPSRKGTRTPIATAVRKAGQDLQAAEGHRLLVLVTDGKEDCGGDPAAAISRLAGDDVTSTVHLIGYALPDEEGLRGQLAEWAAIGGGRFLEATDRASLAAALERATTAPYLVFDEDAALVAQGLVGDEGVEVEAGVYRVDVLTDPPMSFEAVELEAGAEVDLGAEGQG